MSFRKWSQRLEAGAVLLLGMSLQAGAQSRTLQTSLRLSVTDQKVSDEKGVKQKLPRGSMQARTLGVSHVITVQRMDATLPDRLTAEWLVVVETVEGARIPADYGERDIELPVGRPVEVVTPPVSLSGRSWGGRKSGSVQDQIVGVAVRIRKEDGTIVAEQYQPKDIESKVDDWIEQSQKPGEGPDRFRARNRRLRNEGASLFPPVNPPPSKGPQEPPD
jgi:hypothetical protein